MASTDLTAGVEHRLADNERAPCSPCSRLEIDQCVTSLESWIFWRASSRLATVSQRNSTIVSAGMIDRLAMSNGRSKSI